MRPSARLRGAGDRRLGEALQDQRLVAGIGNMWMAEALWTIQVSPWLRVGEASDETLRDARRGGPPADAGVARHRPARPPGLPARRAAVPALRHDRPLARAGRRQPHGLLVSRLPSRSGTAGGVSRTDGGTRSAPAPHPARLLSGRLRLPRPRARGRRRPAVRLRGARAARTGPRCTSTGRSCGRSSSRARARSRAARMRGSRSTSCCASRPLRSSRVRTPARRPSEEQALFRTVLLSLLISTAESCGGFDWDDTSFERAYAELERSLFGAARAYAAVAPLVGISVVTQVELGDGIRIRAAATGELAHHWPEAQGLLPRDFGREVDRYCVLELERGLEAGAEPPDAPAELADAVSAIRLATGAPVAAGPVLFERLDWRPFGIQSVLPIAATQPPGEPTRLDSFRAELAARAARAARARRRRHGARRGARPLGALALPERAVPLRAAARRARRPARRHLGAPGGRAARRLERGAPGDPRCAAGARFGRAGLAAGRGRRPPLARRDAPPRRPRRARALARRHAARAAVGAAARRDRLARRIGTHS